MFICVVDFPLFFSQMNRVILHTFTNCNKLLFHSLCGPVQIQIKFISAESRFYVTSKSTSRITPQTLINELIKNGNIPSSESNKGHPVSSFNLTDILTLLRLDKISNYPLTSAFYTVIEQRLLDRVDLRKNPNRPHVTILMKHLRTNEYQRLLSLLSVAPNYTPSSNFFLYSLNYTRLAVLKTVFADNLTAIANCHVKLFNFLPETTKPLVVKSEAWNLLWQAVFRKFDGLADSGKMFPQGFVVILGVFHELTSKKLLIIDVEFMYKWFISSVDTLPKWSINELSKAFYVLSQMSDQKILYRWFKTAMNLLIMKLGEENDRIDDRSDKFTSILEQSQRLMFTGLGKIALSDSTKPSMRLLKSAFANLVSTSLQTIPSGVDQLTDDELFPLFAGLMGSRAWAKLDSEVQIRITELLVAQMQLRCSPGNLIVAFAGILNHTILQNADESDAECILSDLVLSNMTTQMNDFDTREIVEALIIFERRHFRPSSLFVQNLMKLLSVKLISFDANQIGSIISCLANLNIPVPISVWRHLYPFVELLAVEDLTTIAYILAMHENCIKSLRPLDKEFLSTLLRGILSALLVLEVDKISSKSWRNLYFYRTIFGDDALPYGMVKWMDLKIKVPRFEICSISNEMQESVRTVLRDSLKIETSQIYEQAMLSNINWQFDFLISKPGSIFQCDAKEKIKIHSDDVLWAVKIFDKNDVIHAMNDQNRIVAQNEFTAKRLFEFFIMAKYLKVCPLLSFMHNSEGQVLDKLSDF